MEEKEEGEWERRKGSQRREHRRGWEEVKQMQEVKAGGDRGVGEG